MGLQWVEMDWGGFGLEMGGFGLKMNEFELDLVDLGWNLGWLKGCPRGA